jgi:hypothetical protein
MAAMALPSIAMVGLQTLGVISSAGAAQASARSQQNASNYNAVVDAQKSESALQQAGLNEEQQRRRSAMALGAAAAGLSESGIGLDGSGGNMFKQSAQNAELDALNIRYGGKLQSLGYKNQAVLDKYSADVAGSNANAAVMGGVINAGAAALAGYNTYGG